MRSGVLVLIFFDFIVPLFTLGLLVATAAMARLVF